MPVMPFGKFRGLEITDLPDWYIRWVAKLPNLRDPLLSSIRAEVQRRASEETESEHAYGAGDACPNPKLADELIGAGVRSLAKKYHPDVGGSNEQMRDVNTTAEWLRRQSKGIEC
jgi:hypothetical protein